MVVFAVALWWRGGGGAAVVARRWCGDKSGRNYITIYVYVSYDLI